MPLYKEWNIGDHGLAAIWKIEEPEVFFKAQTGLEPVIKNQQRRMEHLAGRFLLQQLKADFPILDIDKDEHDKPRIANNEYFFSISHSWPYIAVVIDARNEAGIDIQTWHPSIARIQHKYLSATEQEMFPDDQLLTLAWCAKEAVYKWNGRRGIDFIDHMPIAFFEENGNYSKITINLQSSTIAQSIFIESFMSADFACSYVTNAV